MQAYSNPADQNDPHKLPDVEIFQIQGGWFYHFCVPGCLPDSSPMGPYATPEEALSAAQEEVGV